MLRKIENFGGIAAEQDSVLEYFLTTEAVESIESGNVLLVLGRKGSGKTALVKHFTERGNVEHGRPLSFRSYPWITHSSLIDKGASKTEAYVASWRLLIAIRLASMVENIGHGKLSTDSLRRLQDFLMGNFGSTDPDIRSILSAKKIKVTGFSINPAIAGIQLGSINFGDTERSNVLGLELYQLANSILFECSEVIAQLKIKRLFLHFDELDQGLDQLDQDRKNMIIGLVLAAREISVSSDLRANISPIVYLRSDIWDQIEFSDKNKITRGSTVKLIWNSENLKLMVNNRISKQLGRQCAWEELDDGAKMRGTQDKWQHLISRTFLRPRDVIQFLNEALILAKKRDVETLLFQNDDINECRNSYSNYLRDELNDEINPHWPEWAEALQACTKSQTVTFQKEIFVNHYNSIKTKDNRFSADEALEQLYKFSVIGYLQPVGGGGSSWSFRYIDETSGWDRTATRLKVHLGLKEHAKLKEERKS